MYFADYNDLLGGKLDNNCVVLKLHGSDEISDGSGGSSATHVSKRKSKGEEDNDFEDQLSVKKKQGPKKIKGE
uniref:Uncharacterized protein n=1 Tax=Brassica campestris TaxID=3711 RepID=M4FEW2_BRACM